MADVVLTAAQAAGILKRVYGPRIEEQVNRKPFLWRLFDRNKTGMFMGEGWFFPTLHEGGSGAVGSRADGEILPETTPETVVQANVGAKLHYGRVKITGFAMSVAKTNPQSFIRSKALEMKGKTNWLISDLNRQSYNASDGVIGVEVSDGVNTITFGPDTDMNHFRVGMRIDMWDTTLTTKKNGTASVPNEGQAITNVNKVTRTITYAGTDRSGSLVAGDKITADTSRVGLAGSAESKELNGLRFICDDGTDSIATYQGLSRSTYPNWNSNRLGNSSVLRPLSLDLMQTGIDAVDISSTEVVDCIICGHGQRRNYANLIQFDVRYQPMKFTAGFQTMEYSGIPILIDKDCPPQRMFFLKKDTIQKFYTQEIGILDAAGVGAERVHQYDIYELLIGAYLNYGCVRPNANAQIVDIQEP